MIKDLPPGMCINIDGNIGVSRHALEEALAQAMEQRKGEFNKQLSEYKANKSRFDALAFKVMCCNDDDAILLQEFTSCLLGSNETSLCDALGLKESPISIQFQDYPWWCFDFGISCCSK